jgi:hypothetical protein
MEVGGPEEMARTAAAAVMRSERELWLGWLESMEPFADLQSESARQMYIHNLRRKLRLGVAPDIKRAQTRERVRRFRERQRAAS